MFIIQGLAVRMLMECSNVFAARFKGAVMTILAKACVENGITDEAEIVEIINLTSASMIDAIRQLPGVTNDEIWNNIVYAGQVSYAYAYKYVYYVSLGTYPSVRVSSWRLLTSA